MAKAGRVIKLSTNMKPFVSRVVRDGAVQKAFGEKIGTPVGNCVKTALNGKTGLTKGVIHAVAKKCATKGATSLGLPVKVKGQTATQIANSMVP